MTKVRLSLVLFIMVCTAIILTQVLVPTFSIAQEAMRQCIRLEEKDEKLNQNCVDACDTKKKARLLNQIVKNDKQMQVRGCDRVRVLNDFCGGILDSELTGIAITPSLAEIFVGESVEFTAGFTGLFCEDDPTTPEVETVTGEVLWFVDNPSVATISQSTGQTVQASGEAPGVSTIFAISRDIEELQGQAVVNVECDLETATVTVAPSSAEILLGESVQLTATVVAPSCSGLTIAWRSLDEAIASVDQTGLVTGALEGTTTIIAELVDNPAINDETTVTVTNVCDKNDDGILDSGSILFQGSCCGFGEFSAEWHPSCGVGGSCPGPVCGNGWTVCHVCVTGEVRTAVCATEEADCPEW